MRMWMHTFCLLLVLALAGCAALASPRRAGTGGGGTTSDGTNASGSGISGDPRAGLQQINDYLMPQGQQMIGNAIRNADMAGGSFLAYPINTQPGTCYTAVAVASGSSNLDMVLLDPAGRTIEYNVDPDHHPWISFCADRGGRYSARLQMARGSGGEYYYALYQGGSAADLRPLAGAGAVPQVGGGDTGTAPVSADMEREFSLSNSDILARGYEPFGEPHRAELNQGEVRDLALTLEGGKCYALLAVGDRSVQNLDVILLDQRAQQIDSDVEVDAKPIVRVCPQNSGSFTMRVAMSSGRGHFAYAAYQWPRGTRGAFGLAGLIYVRLMEVTQLLQVEGYAPDENFSPGQGQLARQGQTASHNVDLPQGSCYAVLVVGGDGVVDLDVALTQGGRTLATDDSRNAFPDVRHCVDQAGAHAVAIRAANGSGRYFYQVFRQQ